jgi:hypothetical protein
MFRKLIFTSLAGIALGSSGLLAADQPSAAEAKLRESLRATMLQLRTAETERANLQAAQAESEAKNKSLTEQMEALTKQAAANQGEADRAITELKGKVEERDKEIGLLRVALEKSKTDHYKMTEFARAKETQRAGLAEKVIELNHVVSDQQRRNLAMYNLGTEILTRYEKFGLGTALTAREPFIGLTRVKFENLIQDYGDKLTDERIKVQTLPAPGTQKPAPSSKPARNTQPTPPPASKSKPTKEKQKSAAAKDGEIATS